MSNLIIVESPTKVNSIKNFLGSGYKVIASKGHVKDLPKSTLGVDTENDFAPKYINIRGKAQVINELKKEAKSAKKVFLATDPDREGEAIAWHLAQVLNLSENDNNRITFNEITKTAVKAAIANPRKIDMDLVDSQQTRRILDRIVGYKISPLLWKKVKNGLSAGRVQSVATRLVVDREKEIREFKSEEYWVLSALLNTLDKKSFKAKFYSLNNKKTDITSKEQCDKILLLIEGAKYNVESVKMGTKTKTPLPPFTTSQLLQDANRKLNFQSQKTMRVAQELYEGVRLGKKSGHGLITYMRTDSLRISQEASNAARELIISKYGEKFYPEKPRFFKSKGSAQDAHEAIRPTDINLLPQDAKEFLSNEQYRLYKLIWERFVASQMANAIIDTVNANISAKNQNGDVMIFKATGETVKFGGFLNVYEEVKDETTMSEEKTSGKLPKLNEGDDLILNELVPTQNFTEPPLRYTEASLIKALEEKGIGRPSTYTPTVTTILNRGYIERKGKFFSPTALGEITNELMEKSFSSIIDYEFTARLEKQLDEIADGKEKYVSVLGEFYENLSNLLKKADEELKKENFSMPKEELDITCPNCQSKMIVKHGRFGKFAACPNYPACKTTLPLDKNGTVAEKKEEKIVDGMLCELCGGNIVLRKGKFGDFYACQNYPKCTYTKQMQKDTGVTCPDCGGKIIIRKGKKRFFYGCENYPECNFSSWDLPSNKRCPECNSILLVKKNQKQLYCSNKK